VRLRATAFFEVLLPGSKIRIDLRLVSKVIGYRAVHLLEGQRGKIVSDRFCGVAVEEAVDD
jgi:hypothetical protein